MLKGGRNQKNIKKSLKQEKNHLVIFLFEQEEYRKYFGQKLRNRHFDVLTELGG